ncbi:MULTISPECIES: DUF4190 domain-containing protein [unclassified Leifsonia]|uniref:DUF4190 domain-containing protein n=1 Tax=unclassified Leifsonia TaxID=2663824 RepID=UPI0008A72912|nr:MULTISPECIES: DUF4190 domain-containing protein [unclassified Leifsonia]SEH85456.1 protein of unknown function [Leifsonia sp. CL154]SFL47961.1 protein of unknown function [Leifsonia sp. CL147]
MTTPQLPAPTQKINTIALVGFIAAFMVPIAGIVLGIIGLQQTRTSGEGGRGLARAAVLIGSLFTLFGVVFFIVWLSLFLQAFSHISSAG